ncbi:MAG: hypothetical protein AAF846_26380 [Chloroflexota bacterium]
MKRIISLLILLFMSVISITAQATPQIITDGAYQSYENGMMLWRADTEDIWVLYNTGLAESFPVSLYENLPPNPIQAVPDWAVMPINGFGRIWGNFSSVRNKIGNALSNEVSYTMNWELESRGNGVINFSLLTNVPISKSRIAIHDNGTWEYRFDEAPCIACDPIYVAYQAFQNGYMLYDFETGMIYVVTNTSTIRYPSYIYGALSLDPVVDIPPAGLHKPILGFGKVWGHFSNVRDELGWATAPEYAFEALRAEVWDSNNPDVVYITLPNQTTLGLIR